MQKNFLKFKSNNIPRLNTTILFGCCDVGETNTLIPIIKSLITENEYQLELLTKNPATDIFNKNELFSKTEEIITTPELIITGYSKDSEIQHHLIKLSKEKNIPIILVEDFPGNFTRYKQLFAHLDYLPTVMCAFDQDGKQLEINELSIASKKVIITGQPAYDELSIENTNLLYQKLRNKLHINQKLITFFGATNNLSRDTLKQIVKTLSEIQQEYKFAFRPHPKDNENYDSILKPLATHTFQNENITTNELNIISDLVISINSTEGIRAVIRNKLVIQLQLSELILKYPEIDLLPTAQIIKQFGIVIKDNHTLAQTFNSFLQGNINKKSQNHHSSPATPKVLSIIKSLIPPQ